MSYMGSIRPMVLLVGYVGDNVGGGKMKPCKIRQWFYHNPRLLLASLIMLIMIFDNDWLSPWKE